MWTTRNQEEMDGRCVAPWIAERIDAQPPPPRPQPPGYITMYWTMYNTENPKVNKIQAGKPIWVYVRMLTVTTRGIYYTQR